MILNVESGQRMILNVKSVQSVISMQNQAKVSTASLEFLPHGCTQFISNSSLTNWAAVDSTKASLYTPKIFQISCNFKFDATKTSFSVGSTWTSRWIFIARRETSPLCDGAVGEISVLEISLLEIPLLEIPLLEIPLLEIPLLEIPLLEIHLLEKYLHRETWSVPTLWRSCWRNIWSPTSPIWNRSCYFVHLTFPKTKKPRPQLSGMY